MEDGGVHTKAGKKCTTNGKRLKQVYRRVTVSTGKARKHAELQQADGNVRKESRRSRCTHTHTRRRGAERALGMFDLTSSLEEPCQKRSSACMSCFASCFLPEDAVSATRANAILVMPNILPPHKASSRQSPAVLLLQHMHFPAGARFTRFVGTGWFPVSRPCPPKFRQSAYFGPSSLPLSLSL